MKATVDGKVYDTDTAYLMKYVVRPEELGNGYLRITSIGLYFRRKKEDYFIHLNQVSTDNRSMVFDRQDYFYACSDEFARKFNSSYDYLEILQRPCFSINKV